MRRLQSKEKEVERILNMYPNKTDLRAAVEKQRELCFHADTNASRFNIDMNLGKEVKSSVNIERLDKLMELSTFHRQLCTYMLCALYGPNW